MRTFAASTFALLVAAAAIHAQPPMPRPAPAIDIVEPSGKSTPLASYHGKVVVLALIHTTCPHCQKECELLTQLYSEMKPKGVQMAAIAFNDNAAALVPGFVRDHGVLFPVGFTKPETVLGFLGFSVMERYNVPQMAVIDKKGVIRAQSGPMGDPNLQDPNNLRNLINSLLAEGAAPAATTSKTSGKTPATNSAKTPAKGTADTKPVPKSSTN
jgi:peroxiredoxin